MRSSGPARLTKVNHGYRNLSVRRGKRQKTKDKRKKTKVRSLHLAPGHLGTRLTAQNQAKVKNNIPGGQAWAHGYNTLSNKHLAPWHLGTLAPGTLALIKIKDKSLSA